RIESSSILNIYLPYKDEENYNTFDYIEIYSFKSILRNIKKLFNKNVNLLYIKALHEKVYHKEIKKELLSRKKLVDVIAYETLLSFLKRKNRLRLSGDDSDYINYDMERMKCIFKNIIKDQDKSNINIIKSIIERETVKILRCYFYDIVKSKEYIYKELKNYNEKYKKNNNDFPSSTNYQDMENKQSEASTSTTYSPISSTPHDDDDDDDDDANHFNAHPIIKEGKKTTFYHISCEDEYNYILPRKNKKVKNGSVVNDSHDRIINNMQEQTEFLKIKFYLCRYSFIKIIHLFKYFEKKC
ncbi:hypothetical protein PIROE2DRAFT_5629, partial [Piromyces sp. E2]